MRKFHITAIILGVTLFFFLIWKIGPGALWREFTVMGWGLVPFVLIEGIVKVFHTVALRHCLSPPYSSLPLGRLYKIYLAGSSINFFTPTATIGGEVVKGALLTAEHPGSGAATGVIVGKLAYAFSQFFMVLLGLVVVLWKIPLPASAYAGLIVGSVLLGSGIIGFLVVQRKGKLGAIVRWVADRSRSETLNRWAQYITKVDDDLRLFYRENPTGLPVAISWHMVGYLVSMLKTWYFLSLFTHEPFMTAAGIWLLSTWLDLMVFFVPLEIGLQESIRVVVFSFLGFTMALGLTYGIALRVEQLFWGVAGLLIYMALLPPRQVVDVLPEVVVGDDR